MLEIAKAANFQRSAAAPVTIVAAVSMKTIWNRNITITPTSYVEPLRKNPLLSEQSPWLAADEVDRELAS